MFKKLLVALLVVAVLMFGAILYKKGQYEVPKNTVTVDENAELPTLRTAYGEWPPDLIAYLAQEKGYFESNNVNVELVQISGFEELFELIENGDLDVWPVTLLDAVIAYSEGENWQVILLEDFSAGADAIVTYPSSGIKTIADLEGRAVGVETGTVGEFFLQILLQREDLNLSDLKVVDMSFDEIPLALKNGEIDAGITYQPAITESLNDGAVVLVDSEKERGVIVDVYAGYADHISDNELAYINFSRAILDAAEFYKDNPEEALEIMGVPFGNSGEELADAFVGLEIPTLRQNQTAFNRASGFESLFILGKQAEQYLEEQDLISPSANLDSLFSDIVENLDL